MLDFFNTLMSLLLSLVAGIAIMHQRILDGIIIKTGLMFISVGFLGAFFVGLEKSGQRPMAISYTLVHIGLLICIAGYLLRRRSRGKQRRLNDFMSKP